MIQHDYNFKAIERAVLVKTKYMWRKTQYSGELKVYFLLKTGLISEFRPILQKSIHIMNKSKEHISDNEKLIKIH